MFLQKISVFNGKKINHDFFGPESKKKNNNFLAEALCTLKLFWTGLGGYS